MPENTSLKDFYSTKEEFEQILSSINVRKITNPTEKDWFKKIKRYYKEYGWNMNFFLGQKKRLDLIIESLKEE